MRNILPYYKHMVNDWLTGNIQRYSFEIKGFFVDICDQIWLANGCLSIAQAELAYLLRTDEPTVKRLLGLLVDAEIIKVSKNGSYSVDFISEQLHELTQLHNSKVLAGRKGGQAKLKHSSSTAKAKLKHSESESESDSDTKSDTDNKSSSIALNDTNIEVKHISKWEAEFEECWKLYPDKSGKEKAKKAFEKAYKDGVRQEDVLLGLNRYACYIKAQREGGFKDLRVKNGATWFNQRCWQDEYTTEDRSNAKLIFE